MPAALTTVMALTGDSGERRLAVGCDTDPEGDTFRLYCVGVEHLKSMAFLLANGFASDLSGLGDRARWFFHSQLFDRLEEEETECDDPARQEEV